MKDFLTITAKDIQSMDNADLVSYSRIFAKRKSELMPTDEIEISNALMRKLTDRLEYDAVPNDYYRSVHDDYKVNDGDLIADQLSHFVNGKMWGATEKHFVKRVTETEHRYLQNETFKLFEKCIHGWADAYRNNKADGRNDYAVRASECISNYLHSDKFWEDMNELRRAM